MKDDLEFNIKFIELVQERPCLYDYNRTDYSNRNSQDSAWTEIARKLNESVADCKERWKNLRGCYTRHLKNNNKPSGSSAKRVKPYYLAEQLQFLDSFTKSRPPKGVFKLEEPSTEEERETATEIDDDTEQSREFDTPPPSSTEGRVTNNQNDENFQIPNKMIKKNKYVSLRDVNASAMSYFESKKLASSNSKEKQDPDLAFLYSLLPDVKDMTREQKRTFKIGVLQLISNIFQSSSEVGESTSDTYDGSSLHTSTTFTVTPQINTAINSISDSFGPSINNSELPPNILQNSSIVQKSSTDQSQITAEISVPLNVNSHPRIFINKDGTLSLQ